MRASVRVLIAMALAAPAGTAAPGAQSRRAPTAAEAQVLTRFIGAITSTVDGFADENWEVKGGTFPEDASQETVSVRPGLPLGDCIGGDRTWAVRKDSPRYNTRLKPLYARIVTLGDAMTGKYAAGQNPAAEKLEIDRLRQQIDSAKDVTMDVCGNSPNVSAAALLPGTPSLLPGVAAHKVSPGECGGAPACYVLAFGDWKSARPDASRQRYDFHFVHAAGSPYLENVVIRFKGADDRIQDMLKADWTRVGAALGGPTTTQTGAAL